jgi:glycosyltransferase involved in cell wall biosynthesis
MLVPRNTCQPKKALIFIHSYAIQFIDIANQYTRLFDNEKVTVVYLVGKADEYVKSKTLAKNVIFLDSPPKVTRGLKISAIKKMLRLQRESKFDVVICHRYKPTYIMLWVAKFCQIPQLISVMHELGTLRHIMRRLLIALLAPKNMIISGVSNAVRNDLRQDIWGIPPGRVLTLYNMIDVDHMLLHLYERAEARAKLGLLENAFIFGNLGRLAVNKDQKTLIEAFARIKLLCPDAKLAILGDGQLESQLKQQVIDLSLTSDVIFLGFVKDGSFYMKAFDAYVSSSIQEAFGRVLLEAMVAKVPTIATRVHGMPEVLGDTGVIVEPRQPEQLAQAMMNAYQLSAAERMEWGEKEFRRVTQEFSIPRFTEVMEQILLPGLDSNQ